MEEVESETNHRGRGQILIREGYFRRDDVNNRSTDPWTIVTLRIKEIQVLKATDREVACIEARHQLCRLRRHWHVFSKKKGRASARPLKSFHLLKQTYLYIRTTPAKPRPSPIRLLLPFPTGSIARLQTKIILRRIESSVQLIVFIALIRYSNCTHGDDTTKDVQRGR